MKKKSPHNNETLPYDKVHYNNFNIFKNTKHTSI